MCMIFGSPNKFKHTIKLRKKLIDSLRALDYEIFLETFYEKRKKVINFFDIFFIFLIFLTNALRALQITLESTMVVIKKIFIIYASLIDVIMYLNLIRKLNIQYLTNYTVIPNCDRFNINSIEFVSHVYDNSYRNNS